MDVRILYGQWKSLMITSLLEASFLYPDQLENMQTLQKVSLAEQGFPTEFKCKKEAQVEALPGGGSLFTYIQFRSPTTCSGACTTRYMKRRSCAYSPWTKD